MHARKQTVRERPLHYFSINLAIVEANSGESNEEAWRRHLVQHPQDRQANVKIFNRCSGDPVLELRRRNPAGGWQRVK